MKVSLVATVKDAAGEIGEFLTSLGAQTRPPEEIVIVDGGSTDGTLERLREASEITLLEESGATIARGRNVAVRAATHDAIVVTDADCVLAPDWLERLAASLEDGAEVAMGFYRPIANSFFEACAAAVSLPEAGEIDPDRFMPSSRSIAFRREAFEAAGGYPEWLAIGEDMVFNHRLRELALDLRFVPEAVAYWRVRPTLRQTWDQYFRYARGDAEAGLHPARHGIRFGVYGAAAWTLASDSTALKTALGLAAAWFARRRIRRAFHLLPGRPAERAAALAAVPALIAFSDIAKMAGYLAGRLSSAAMR